jgi:uncharacterized protein YvpB
MNKQNGIYQDAEIGRFYLILDYLSKNIDENKQVIYLVGSTYKDIVEATKIFDAKIIEIKSLRTGWLKIVPIPVSKRFLIKLQDKQDLVEVVRSLEDHDPIEVFVFNKNIEAKFLKNFNIDNRESMRNIITEDSQYLIYGMDFDNMESTTEALEFISYGSDIPKEMKWFF